jgi:hypothetical protein
MDITKLVRDAGKVRSALTELDDKSVVTSREVKIYLPMRYTERSLCNIGSDVYIIGIWAMVVDDLYYGVSLANAMMKIEPTATQTVKIDEDDYLEFRFEAGSTVFSTTDLLKTNTLIYQIFDEIVSKGHVPWYMCYEDLARLFDSSKYHADMKLGGNHAIVEMIMASIARDSKDRTRYFRQVVTDKNEQYTKPPVFIPFRSVIYSATNTTAKLLGSYSSDGMTSALVNPSQRVERIEELLRR